MAIIPDPIPARGTGVKGTNVTHVGPVNWNFDKEVRIGDLTTGADDAPRKEADNFLSSTGSIELALDKKVQPVKAGTTDETTFYLTNIIDVDVSSAVTTDSVELETQRVDAPVSYTKAAAFDVATRAWTTAAELAQLINHGTVGVTGVKARVSAVDVVTIEMRGEPVTVTKTELVGTFVLTDQTLSMTGEAIFGKASINPDLTSADMTGYTVDFEVNGLALDQDGEKV